MKNTINLSRLHGPISSQLGATAYRFRQLLTQHPKGSLALMSTVLIISLILSFTVLRHPKVPHLSASVSFKHKPPGVSQMSGALTAASALSQVLLLQSELNGILSAKHISSKDSARIGEITLQIKILQSKILSDEKDKP